MPFRLCYFISALLKSYTIFRNQKVNLKRSWSEIAVSDCDSSVQWLFSFKLTSLAPDYTPTLKDLQLVGDILFTERTTVGYSQDEQKELIALGDVCYLTSEGRVSVFEKAVQFEKKGKPGYVYIVCIVYFVKLRSSIFGFV